MRQRYWKIKHWYFRKAKFEGMYEFHGTGRDLRKVVILAQYHMSKGFVEVPAERFIQHPEMYGFEDSWIEREVES